MKLELDRIEILNFKSISELTLPVKKYGNSYTAVLVGLNEAGKTNILEAIKFFSKDNLSKNNLNYKEVCCKVDENFNYSEVYYKYNLSDELKEKIALNIDAIDDFSQKLKKIQFYKNLYLGKDETLLQEKDLFYLLDVELNNYAYLKASENLPKKYKIINATELEKDGFENYKCLDIETFSKIIKEILFQNEKINLCDISLWEPTNNYLITQQIDLNQFSTNPTICIPLQNIFALCGHLEKEEISSLLTGISKSDLMKIKTKLSKEVTKYINNVWKEHDIDISIEIDYSNKLLSFYIKDKDDEVDFYEIGERSQGLKQFLSLILTLSIKNKTKQCKNQIILIDEPETHLHPSGIRYIRDEILKIGENNFVFVATHSPFFIDQKNMERHFIVKKEKGITSITPFSKDTKSFDDEVLRQAFGINVLSDFLTPNKILVEGLSDCVLIQKALSIVDPNFCYGITNGQGGNIKQVASILKYHNVPCLVLVDDDKEGREYRDNIQKLGSPFSEKNVLTIHDLSGEIPQNSTIEDCLDKEFIKKIVNRVVCKDNKQFSFIPEDQQPIMTSLKQQIMQAGINGDADNLIKEVKSELSQNFQPTVTSLEKKNPLLKKLADGIITYLKQKR